MNEIKLILGDCLEKFKDITDKSIDLVFTDPPYGLDWSAPIKFKERKDMLHHVETTKKWDNVLELYPILFKEFNRMVKDCGSILMFCRVEHISHPIKCAKENNFEHRATIIYHKTNPCTQVRRRNYLSSFETFIWESRPKDQEAKFVFNFKKQNEMHNFIEMPACGGRERTCHPTQKPLKLIKHFLEIHSNENNLIFDPFFGSGTTAIACKLLNRNFIGFEIDEKYYTLAQERLNKTEIQGELNI